MPRPSLRLAVLSPCLAILLSNLSGCSGPTYIVEHYAGPQRPADQVAILRVNGGKSPDLLSIDGERVDVPVENGTRMHIEVLPGVHELSVSAPIQGDPIALPVRFVAEPGRVYRVEIAAGAPDARPVGTSSIAGFTAEIYEVDRRSDTPLRLVHPAREGDPDGGSPNASRSMGGRTEPSNKVLGTDGGRMQLASPDAGGVAP